MPFASNAELPDSIKDALPNEAQTVFRNVANKELGQGGSEESAFSQAWAAVKNGWEKSEDGQWVKKFFKFDHAQQIAYGWGSVISKGGKPVVDLQGDIIEPHELEKATTEFMLEARKSMAMHQGEKVGDVVHSFPLTEEIADALGVVADQEGWIVGVKIHDSDVWKRVVSGEYSAFSIGGHAAREKVE